MKCTGGNLHAGRIAWVIIQRLSQLHSAPPKGLQGDLKRPNESDYQVRSTSALIGNGSFSSSRGVSWPLTTCVSKRHSSSFHIRRRQGEKLIGNLSGLGAFLVSSLTLSHAEKGGGGTTGLRWSWPKVINVVQPRIHTGEYYSAVKTRKFYHMLHLKDIGLREINQSQKDKYRMIPLVWGTWVVKLLETDSRRMVARDWEAGRGVSV